MKNFKIGKNNCDAFDGIDYTDPEQMKRLIRYMSALETQFDDASEVCVLTDIKSALNTAKILTAKQVIVIKEHLIHDKSQKDLAIELNTTQQNISLLLKSGISRIIEYISTGELKWTSWSDSERDFLLENYETINIGALCKKLDKPRSRVVSMYHYLKNRQHKAEEAM